MIIGNISYRKATEKDLDALLDLRVKTMESHLINSGVNTTEEFHLERIKYKFENAEIILLENIEVGLLKIMESNEKIEIIQIQISSSFRGKGIGTKIIKEIIGNAIQNNLSVTLSVLKENKAKKLYQNLGFEIISSSENSFEMEFKKCTS